MPDRNVTRSCSWCQIFDALEGGSACQNCLYILDSYGKYVKYAHKHGQTPPPKPVIRTRFDPNPRRKIVTPPARDEMNRGAEEREKEGKRG